MAFQLWVEKWPERLRKSPQKARRIWEKTFDDDPSIPEGEGREEFIELLNTSLERQLHFRKTVLQRYPTPEDRRKAGIFLPNMKMPAGWLNDGDWNNPVETLDAVDPVKQNTKNYALKKNATLNR